ncbi:hypothetical protein PC129_g19918 [Phytophthora cactorum]|uniref:Uncharacterized protein n=1 Tax=Phytophthora cactorum TaxID=29920 RepID=A0A8T1HB73_9STRA|nr:hypothetical protein PC114_g24692 [Phytophthora cactorum]KAG2886939.1 hypothetical protein PC115_g20519 [Phytophthora cactorum]KAG3068708.1 hypothetical protein PC122_g16832 [Phytophthora cactorum]KAG3209062.1 hypothetical protein PC129_g19918 [Phytophthora cactorum]
MARIRSSTATRQSAVADAARDVDFKHLCRQLWAAGWASSKPSLELENAWTYFTPSGESFVGEHAVVTFVIESGLSVDSSDEDSDAETEVGSCRASALNETVTSSQIDTSIMLSVNTIEHMFDSDGEDVAEPVVSTESVRADADAHVDVDASNGDADADEGGGVEDGNKVSAEEGESVEDEGEVAVASSDVNGLANGDLSDGYETVGLSGSDDSDNSGDEAIVRREYPSDVDEPDKEVAVMDAAFIEALGGNFALVAVMDAAFIEALGGNLALVAIDMEALRTLDWSSPPSEFEFVQTEYPQLSSNVVAPIHELQDMAESPLMLFFYFVPRSLWVLIVKETNRYKKQTVKA